jgi:ABC-2 type transport system permease protein
MNLDLRRAWAVTRFDLRQLRQSPDFWVPMAILGALFFVILPTILLTVIGSTPADGAMAQVSQALDLLPQTAQDAIPVADGPGRTTYALAVYLFAPIAIVVPLTIATAIGAAALVGERERGTGEFLAHSPAHIREIYLGKLLASLIPGYVTTIVGFGCYSLVVNLTVGPDVGGWFFPTGPWWILMGLVVPGFVLLCLSIVVRVSGRVRSTVAAQQVAGLISLPLIVIAYGQATGLVFAAGAGLIVAAIVWLVALTSLQRAMANVSRSRLLGVADGL